jgi:hypothetical protein
MADSKNLNKSMIPSDEQMLSNFLAWYALAQTKQERFAVNMQWYVNANYECECMAVDLSREFGVQLSIHTVCQVVSCLSPGKNWELNLADAGKAIRAYFLFQDLDDRKAYLKTQKFGVGYTWENCVNAFNALDGNDIPETREKTFAFARNLEFPKEGKLATVDQHMIHILTGTRLKGSINPGSHYKRLAKVVLLGCKLLGVTVEEGQAAVWGFRVDSFKAGVSVDSLCDLVEGLIDSENIL